MGFQINQVTVSGNLTREPELRQTPGGLAITSFGLAHNERRKNGNGEWEDRAHFFDVVMFGGQGEWLSKNVGKGDPVTVAGQLTFQQWEAKDGSGKRSKVEIIARDVAVGQRGGGGGAKRQQGYAPDGYETGAQQPQQGYQGGSYGGGGGDYSEPQHPPQQQAGGRLADPGEDDIPF